MTISPSFRTRALLEILTCLSGMASRLVQCPILYNCNRWFLLMGGCVSWQVGGEPVFPGPTHEPILLHINYPKCGQGSEEGSGVQQYDDGSVEMVELNCGFPKDSGLLHLRVLHQ